MANRLFEKFPQSGVLCPICQTNDDRPCFLMAIDGTQKDSICEAAPTHADCIRDRLGDFQYQKEYGIIYMRLPVASMEMGAANAR